MPIAVITESSEKTRSRRAICNIRVAKHRGRGLGDLMGARPPLPACGGSRGVAFAEQEDSADQQDQVATGKALRRSSSKTACSVRRAIQASESENSSAMSHDHRQSQPDEAALFCLLLFAGSRPVRIEMKMMLSIPRTISSAVSVRNANQTSGFKRNSGTVAAFWSSRHH